MTGADEIQTGSIVAENVGPDGDEIAVAICLPRAAWERLSAGLLDVFYGDGTGKIADDEAPIETRIGLFLELIEAEWSVGPIRQLDDSDDDDVPF